MAVVVVVEVEAAVEATVVAVAGGGRAAPWVDGRVVVAAVAAGHTPAHTAP